MKKFVRSIIILLIISASVVLAYKIGKDTNNKSSLPIKNDSSIENSTENTTRKYVFLESIADKLNKKGNNLNLYKEFSTYVVAYEPMYSIKKEYANSAKNTAGEIVAVTKYVKGTYRTKGDLLIDVLIVQDKTFENSGFIYMSDNKENYIIYKYKETYLIFKYAYDFSDNSKNKSTSDFIKEFYNVYSKLYVTQPNS